MSIIFPNFIYTIMLDVDYHKICVYCNAGKNKTSQNAISMIPIHLKLKTLFYLICTYNVVILLILIHGNKHH